MVYTISNGLRDREYNKFSAIQTGSLAAINITSVSGAVTAGVWNNVNVKVYDFPVGSIAAKDTGAPISGGNFQSFTDVPINGIIKAIVWTKGNNTNGSLFLTDSGTDIQMWGTITRDLTTSFAVYPKATCVTTTDASTTSGNTVWFDDIYSNGVLKIVGSDFGKLKGGSGFKIVYI